MPAKKPSVSLGAIAKFEEQITKSYGSGVMDRGGAKKAYEVIPTGVLGLDAATVAGGYIEGRISHIWGPGDSSKSSLALMAIAQAQKKYPQKMCAYVDVERKWDDSWAEMLGVDRSRVFLFRPTNAEDTSDIVKDFIVSDLCSLVVIDSIGAMIGQKEQEKDAGEATVAIVAKIVTRMIKAATANALEHKVAVLILNQVRDQIGSRTGGQMYPGGWALRHGSTLQIKLRSSSAPTDIKKVRINGEEIPVAHKIVAKVERNKVAPPGDVASWTFVNRASDRFGPVGVDTADEAVSLGERFGSIERSGAYYTLVSTGERVQGREAMVEVLRHSPEEITSIRSKVLSVLSEKLVEDEAPTIPEEAPEEVPEVKFRHDKSDEDDNAETVGAVESTSNPEPPSDADAEEAEDAAATEEVEDEFTVLYEEG